MRQVALPGGLWHEGQLHKTAMLIRLTGAVERELSEMRANAQSVPEGVSRILGRAVTSCGELSMNLERARALCVADRQALMLELGIELQGEQVWLHPSCSACGMVYDVGYQRSEVPVRPAGTGYPFCSVVLRSSRIRLRVPTGADQEVVAALDPELALVEMLRLCMIPFASEEHGQDLDALARSLTSDEYERLDQALEAVAPAVGTTIATSCAECGAPQSVELDPYDVHQSHDPFGLELEDEIHAIAMHYHWSEREILDLPRERRHQYLHRIERQRGASM